MALAEAKAPRRRRQPIRDACVIGADQTLEFDGRQLHKPAIARRRARPARSLAGRSHRLHTAVAGIRRGRRLADGRERDSDPRPLSAPEIDAYLARVGDEALESVGAYQIEGPGIQLFERIDGDYFAILGLPLLPLLDWLREEGALG